MTMKTSLSDPKIFVMKSFRLSDSSHQRIDSGMDYLYKKLKHGNCVIFGQRRASFSLSAMIHLICCLHTFCNSGQNILMAIHL